MKLSPLEVDRYLYTEKAKKVTNLIAKVFPSPLEVDRYLYKNKMNYLIKVWFEFPSPLEVDRYIYKKVKRK